jgi:hypothetical protein
MVLSVLVLPDPVVPLILGTDFFVKAGLIPDIAGSCFLYSPETRIPFLSLLPSDFSLQTVVQRKHQGVANHDVTHLSSEQLRRVKDTLVFKMC